MQSHRLSRAGGSPPTVFLKNALPAGPGRVCCLLLSCLLLSSRKERCRTELASDSSLSTRYLPTALLGAIIPPRSGVLRPI